MIFRLKEETWNGHPTWEKTFPVTTTFYIFVRDDKWSVGDSYQTNE